LPIQKLVKPAVIAGSLGGKKNLLHICASNQEMVLVVPPIIINTLIGTIPAVNITHSRNTLNID